MRVGGGAGVVMTRFSIPDMGRGLFDVVRVFCADTGLDVASRHLGCGFFGYGCWLLAVGSEPAGWRLPVADGQGGDV